MFCEKCGNEVQEEWKNCPICGNSLKESTVPKPEISNSEIEVNWTREKFKEELISKAYQKNGGPVLTWGASTLSKDLPKVWTSGEGFINLYSARKNTLLQAFKFRRYIRIYMVCTTQRIIYLERGNMILSFLPFLKKTIKIPYKDIRTVEVSNRTGIYSGMLLIETISKKYEFIMIDKDAAMEVKNNIESRAH